MFGFCQFILTFGYLGLSKKAPGTLGSIGGLFFWLITSKIFCYLSLTIFFQNFLWLAISLIMTLFAIKKIFFYVSNLKNNKQNISENNSKIDNQTIVLDEVVGQIIALQISINGIGENYFEQPKLIILHLFLSLIFFRFFDIKKPLIIGIVDQKMKSPFGVMFDDILSGVIAGCLTLFILNNL